MIYIEMLRHKPGVSQSATCIHPTFPSPLPEKSNAAEDTTPTVPETCDQEQKD